MTTRRGWSRQQRIGVSNSPQFPPWSRTPAHLTAAASVLQLTKFLCFFLFTKRRPSLPLLPSNILKLPPQRQFIRHHCRLQVTKSTIDRREPRPQIPSIPARRRPHAIRKVPISSLDSCRRRSPCHPRSRLQQERQCEVQQHHDNVQNQTRQHERAAHPDRVNSHAVGDAGADAGNPPLLGIAINADAVGKPIPFDHEVALPCPRYSATPAPPYPVSVPVLRYGFPSAPRLG